MKLVLATPLYSPEPGGPATYAELLATLLPAEGVDVSLVTFSTVRGYPKGIRHLVYLFKVLHVARTADVVLALDAVSVGFPSLIAAQMARKPFIVKIVGDFAWEQGTQRFGITSTLDEFTRQGRVSLPVGILRFVQTYVAHHAKHVIVPSKYLEEIVERWGVPRGKIQVIYNSIALPDDTAGVPRAENVLVSIGRFVPWKGMEALIEAVADVRIEYPDTALMLVGSGPQRALLEKKGKELLGDHISFTGPRTHEETLEALRTSGIFVLNSTYEGLSHTLIEALMLGSAIVASDAGGNGEVVTDERTGILFPAGDKTALVSALSRMLSDESFRERLRTTAKESGARFTPTQMIADTRAVLTAAIAPTQVTEPATS